VSASASRRTAGQTLLVAVCNLEPGRVRKLLPPPLTAIQDQAFIYIVWSTLNSESQSVRERSFLEANIALPCHGPAGEGTWFVRAYFPSKELVRHAYLSGWKGVEATVQVGRVPAAVRRFIWPPDTPVGGWVGRDGRREIELILNIGAPVELRFTPLRKFNRVYGVRQLGGRREVTLERHLDDVIHRVHAGVADLRLAGDAAALLGPATVAAGYLIEFGIDLGGSELLPA
jgi:hypothetical protein